MVVYRKLWYTLGMKDPMQKEAPVHDKAAAAHPRPPAAPCSKEQQDGDAVSRLGLVGHRLLTALVLVVYGFIRQDRA